MLDAEVHNKVIFSGVRNDDNNVNPGEDITYTDTVINLKNGLKPETGEFVVPISGIYSFSFAARGNYNNPYTAIEVYKNGDIEFIISDGNGNQDGIYANISYNWMMSLQIGDTIKLEMASVSNGLAIYTRNFAWFNGQLLLAQ